MKEGAMRQRIVAGLRRKRAGMLLAILLGYNGNESDVVDPHKKSQFIFVVLSKEGAMRQRFVAKLRRKLADMFGDLVWVQRERERSHRSTQEVAVDICVRVRVEEDRCHLGKTAGTLANLLVTTLRERRA